MGAPGFSPCMTAGDLDMIQKDGIRLFFWGAKFSARSSCTCGFLWVHIEVFLVSAGGSASGLISAL